MIKKLLLPIEPVRSWFYRKTDAIWFQITGLVLIAFAYIWFGKDGAEWVWLLVLLPVGILELLVIWVWDSTITSFARKLLPKKLDTILALGLIPLTWWQFSPTAAGLLFIGYLVNHFSEPQPKN